MSKHNNETMLQALGWKSSFRHVRSAQLAEPNRSVHRVTEVQRTGLIVAPSFDDERTDVPISGKWFQRSERERPTVGDWVVLDPTDGTLVEVLPRSSLLTRLSPSGNGSLQLIAANVDSAFVVTSCNADFSVPRLERYVSVILEAGIEPVIVLTKIDQTPDSDAYLAQLHSAFQTVACCALNALEPDTVSVLAPWCGAGQTIALLGSSGVGKSTIVNTLMGGEVQRTQAIREEDGKGRHTTTYRSAHILPQGAVILDSPGMREFQMAESSAGVAELFDDIEALAEACRFGDCAHNTEPGCAVQAALALGQLDERRLASYKKLKG